MNIGQELNEDIFERRIHLSEQHSFNSNLLYNTCFPDKCRFMLNNEVNSHNYP